MGTWYVAGMPYSDELYHYGVKGQKHGVRRYQNLDRSLTPLGKEHYGVGDRSGGLVGRKKHIKPSRVWKNDMQTHGEGMGSSSSQLGKRPKAFSGFTESAHNYAQGGKGEWAKSGRKKNVVGAASSSSMQTHGSGIGSSGPQIANHGQSYNKYANRDLGKDIQVGMSCAKDIIAANNEINEWKEQLKRTENVDERWRIKGIIEQQEKRKQLKTAAGKMAVENFFKGLAWKVTHLFSK